MPAQSLRDAHRGRVCVRAFIGVNVCSCMWTTSIVLCSEKTIPTYLVRDHGSPKKNLSGSSRRGHLTLPAPERSQRLQSRKLRYCSDDSNKGI